MITESRMTAKEYQELAARTINEELSDKEKLLHALHGMAAEVGEIHSMYQKLYQGHKFNSNEMMKELGDLLWFIAEYCTVFGWNLEYVMQMNIVKLEARYPEGFSEEKSVNRGV